MDGFNAQVESVDEEPQSGLVDVKIRVPAEHLDTLRYIIDEDLIVHIRPLTH